MPRACGVGSAADKTNSRIAPAYHHHFWPFNMSRSSAASIVPNRKLAGIFARGVNVTAGDVAGRGSSSVRISGGASLLASSKRLRAGSNRSNSNAEKETSSNAKTIQATRSKTMPPVQVIPFHKKVGRTKLSEPTSSENEKLLFSIFAAAFMLFHMIPKPGQSKALVFPFSPKVAGTASPTIQTKKYATLPNPPRRPGIVSNVTARAAVIAIAGIASSRKGDNKFQSST